MKNCDLFCLPSVSRNEAFGLVLVEALYFGKPLVTTNVEGTGMNYVNKHNETGLVVPPKKFKSISRGYKYNFIRRKTLLKIFKKCSRKI
jgi:glycosyltransferase involved in cell wall biosynthesis